MTVPQFSKMIIALFTNHNFVTIVGASAVALELFKIFLMQGAPMVLQSDNGREFVNEVIKELKDLWPDCVIVHGRSRHPQYNGGVERGNFDVEVMIGAWMRENNSVHWGLGCHVVAAQKNDRTGSNSFDLWRNSLQAAVRTE